MSYKPWTPAPWKASYNQLYSLISSNIYNSLLISKAPEMAELLIQLDIAATDGNTVEMYRIARHAVSLLANLGYKPDEQQAHSRHKA